jgi:hypothetical protein
VKRILLLLAVTAMAVLLFTPAAWAQGYSYCGSDGYYDDDYYGYDYCGDNYYYPSYYAASATAGATATATATATALAKTGGLPVLSVTLVASLALMATGVGAVVLLRRSVS